MPKNSTATSVQSRVKDILANQPCLPLTSNKRANSRLFDPFRSCTAKVSPKFAIQTVILVNFFSLTIGCGKYALVCGFPPEYCEFGSSLTRCKEWLKEEHPVLYDRYYSDGDRSLLDLS